MFEIDEDDVQQELPEYNRPESGLSRQVLNCSIAASVVTIFKYKL